MKKILFIAMAFASMFFASCMGDGYADPDNTIKVPAAPVGDNNIKEKNVITIAQLKEDYNSLIANKRYEQIDKDIQIKGYISAPIFLNEPFQQILINLKGLYIGGYGSQAELGGVYTNSTTGAQSIGKVDRYEWNKHFKILGSPDAAKAESLVEVFDKTKIKDADYLKSCSGKLMRIENVQFSQADGKAVYAPETEKDKTNCVNRNLTDAETKTPISASNLLVRTSAYAKFANVALPKDPVNITGIFTRFNNVWQILIRTSNDVETALNVPGGTKEEPYTVTNALKLINAGKYTTDKVYTTGIICEVGSVDTGSYGNATYSISEDGKAVTGKMIKVFRGFNLDNQKWTEETKGTLAVGKKVVICGALTMYNGTPEIDSGNYLISIK